MRRAVTALAGFAVGIYVLVVRGDLTLDLGIGRRLRPLGPLTVTIAAPREIVFDVVASPYLGRTTRALERKLRVVERSGDMVLAEHFTPFGPLTTTTLETVRFERPERVHFRLVRGPVPHVVEQFTLRETGDGTQLHYSGELGTDLWLAGRIWGFFAAWRWNSAVRASLAAIEQEAERRAFARATRLTNGAGSRSRVEPVAVRPRPDIEIVDGRSAEDLLDEEAAAASRRSP